MHKWQQVTGGWATMLLVFLAGGPLMGQVGGLSPAMHGPGGSPFVRNYPPREYGQHNQNWAVVQDPRGVMYFGNTHGVVEYDGASWRLIKIKEEIVRSLALAADGRIYVGGLGDIGYLAPDARQGLQFVSLLPQLDTAYHHFADVWQTLALDGSVYFVTQKYIFRWNGRAMRVWEAQTSFHVGFVVHNRFYVRQRGVGLMQLTADGELVLAPMGAQFAEERIMAMLPAPGGHNHQALLCTRTNGLLRYDGHSVAPFVTEADAIIKTGQLYCATALPGGGYALGTLQQGVVVIDEAGKMQHHLRKSTGLQDETVWYLYPDREGGLWMGLHVGISRAEIRSPHTYFGENEGVEGSVLEVVRHRGLLYLATSMGIYYLDESTSAPGRFRRVEGVSPQCWDLLPFGEALLAASFDGVYDIRGSQGRLVHSAYAMSLHRSQQDTNRVWVGLQAGVKSLYYQQGRWLDEGQVAGIDYEIRHIHEVEDGQYWLTTMSNGILHTNFSGGPGGPIQVARYDTLAGLPAGSRIVAFPSARGLRFITYQGVYRFDPQKRRFEADPGFWEGPPPGLPKFFSVNTTGAGDLWIVSADGASSGLARRQPHGAYRWEEHPFWRTAGLNTYMAYPDPLRAGITWIGCLDRVVRHDARQAKAYDQPYRTLLRQVVANNDTLLYDGAGNLLAPLRISYAYNSLRFRYAAPTFDDESKTVYQYRLEGYDDEWSGWSAETYKDYTGLSPGAYRFVVRAKNIYQQLGDEAVISFRILPPFYLTWWAFGVYILLLAGGLYALRRREMKRLQAKHQLAMEQLEYEKLKELDQLKSRFFADISHEFRTPLTLILGPIDNLLASQPPPERARQYDLVKRNAQRLLRLINQLLDLSKLEAGRMHLEATPTDLIVLLKAVVYAFESRAEAKGIRLGFDSEVDRVIAHIDRDKVEQVVINLVSNALKFTPEGGVVEVKVASTDGGKGLQIDVTDTGPGIPADQLPRVFDRFFQGDEAYLSDEAGTGIGLALSKELVELHGGHIAVTSSPGQGACFRVWLPCEGRAGRAAVPVGPPPEMALPPGYVAPLRAMPTAEEISPHQTTLLLVEDNPDMRAFIRETLAGSYRVLEAADGREGIAAALAHIPDLIISDVMMPHQDGLELCDTLKKDERTSHIPLVLLTAKADIASRLAGLERGADEYLAKPFHREELLLRVRNLLAARQRLQARYASLQPPPPADDQDVQREDAFLQKVREMMWPHLSEVDFDIEQLARMLGMSRSQLFRKIKALTGRSPSLFIRGIRLQRAKELLEQTDRNVSEVAYEVGFSTPAFFSDAFLEAFGQRPSQYKHK